jgi:cytochrome oxidase Cu insertion factor (SCO1/SenC/PrrC family)
MTHLAKAERKAFARSLDAMKTKIFFLLLCAMMAGACASVPASTPAAVMAKELPTATAQTAAPASKATSTVQAATNIPKWIKTTITDVRTGENFSMADYQGKVVLIELMAVWCPLCLTQQQNIAALQKQSASPDVVIVSLDIDASENTDLLKRYVERNGFAWSFALAPRDAANEIAALYGTQFLNPPSTPVLVIDRKGGAHPLGFGIKSAATLQQTIEIYLKEGS